MQLTRRGFFLASSLPLAALGAESTPKRLRRADSFFGMHLDLHPQKSDTALGRDVTDEMVEDFLDRVKPDYVQYDCKGHAGYLGFPSKVGTPSPGIVRDSLEVWRRVTARRGVALYIHFSGVWDSLAIEQHPEWAATGPDGKRSPNQTSTFGPYVDALMIPELEEAAARYGLDGVWVDGECWATNPDYSPAPVQAFREATGMADTPKSPKDPGWLEWLELNRARFRRYVRHYVDRLHSSRPGFQIASNWLYSSFVPERPELPVDFISGDYLGNASISTARLEARYMAQTGKPWDLMAWGFADANSNPVGLVHKPAVQLEQEASVVLAQGGGFQIYYQPTRAGRLDERVVAAAARVGAFCRERQAFCHRSETVPEVGVLFSTTSLYSKTGRTFGGWGGAIDPARGALDALLENHWSVDVLPEWRLGGISARYPVVIVPDWPDVGSEARDVLIAYAKQGGKLVVLGAENVILFRDVLGATISGPAAQEESFIPGEEVFANVTGLWQPAEPGPGARAIFQRYPTYDAMRDGQCAATIAPCGKGTIAAVYGPLGRVFAATHAPAVRQVFARIVERLYAPLVTLDAPPTVEVSIRRKSGRLFVHLVNTTGMQVAGSYSAIDFVPPVGPLRLSVRLSERPGRVTLEPEGRELAGQWKDGRWTGTVNRIAIHAAVAFQTG